MIGCTQYSVLYFLESLYLKMGFVFGVALQIETAKKKKKESDKTGKYEAFISVC